MVCQPKMQTMKDRKIIMATIDDTFNELRSRIVVDVNGTISYMNHKGQLHRKNGPAMISGETPERWWYFDGKLHRADGPAYISGNGYESWWFNGQRHRVDGPAVTYPTGIYEWWLNGKQLDDIIFRFR